MNNKLIIWLGIYIIFVCICHSAAAYHFYYMEQWNTFYWDADVVCRTLTQPGGLPLLVADFLMQFFCYGAGPFIYGFLMILVAFAQSLWVKEGARYLGCITAVAMLMTLMANLSNLFAGSVCFTMVMCLIAVVLRCRKWLKVFAIILIILFVRKNCLVRERTEFNWMVWLPWMTAGIVFLIQIFSLHVLKSVGKYNFITQMVMIIGVTLIFFTCFYHAQDEYMKKIYYYVRNQRWDEIINRSNSRGAKDNVTFQLCRNMALAEKGELGEKLLMFDQQGLNSIMTSDFKTLQVSMLMMDVFYAMGYVNMSQLCAFESQECIDNKSPYLWQRLVDTNIENGAYAVAEKYIKLLERTLAYRDWAVGRRRFLYNDKAVRADKVLGLKCKCIFSDDKLMGNGGFDKDLASIIMACPEHRATLQYLGAMYIVANQRADFLALMKKYRGTKAMPHVPASFAKAMEVFSKQPE